MPNTTESAVSFTERELAGALIPFNELAQLILNYVQQTRRLSEDFFTEWDAALAYPAKFLKTDFLTEAVVAYPVYSAIIAGFILFGGGMFTLGIFWCFCRFCCGRCGSHMTHGRDARHSETARRCCGTLLFFSLVIIIIGCAMASMSVYLLSGQLVVSEKENGNNLDHDLLAWLTAERAKSPDDLLKYAKWPNVQQAQQKYKHVTDYDYRLYGAAQQIATEINLVFSKLNAFVNANFLVELLVESTFATLREAAITSLGFDRNGDAAKWIEQESECLLALKNCIITLFSNYKNVSANLAIVNSTTCHPTTSDPNCLGKIHKMNSYNQEMKYLGNSLGALNVSLTKLQQVRNLQDSVFNYATISELFSKSINESKAQLQPAVLSTSDEVLRFSLLTQKISSLTNMTAAFVSSPSFRKFISYGELYGPYSFWALLGTFAFLALLLMLGLSCGACGARDTAFERGGCCRRTRGSKIMLLSVAMLFLLAVVFAATFLCVFLLAAVSQTEICQSLDVKHYVNNSTSSKTLLEVTINHYLSSYFSEAENQLDFRDFIGRCNSHGGIVDALFDSSSDNFVRALRNQFSSIKIVEPFTASLKNGLDGFSTTASEFEKLHSEIRSATMNIAIQTNTPSILTDRTSTIKTFYQDHEKAMALSDSFSRLNDSLNTFISFKLNHTSSTLLLEWMKNFTYRVPYTENQELLDETITAYINYVKYVAIPCTPLQNAISIFSSTVCNNLLKNMQVLWLGMAFVALVYVPTVLLALRLDILYRRVLPFIVLPKDSGSDGDGFDGESEFLSSKRSFHLFR